MFALTERWFAPPIIGQNRSFFWPRVIGTRASKAKGERWKENANCQKSAAKLVFPLLPHPPRRTGIQGPDVSPLPALRCFTLACLIDALYTICPRRSAAAVCNHFEFALRSHYLNERLGGISAARGTWNHADGGPRAPQLTLIGGPSRAHRPNLVLQPQNTASLAESRVGVELWVWASS